ncbi:type II inositol polyphosphate 5-phosphatase 15-like [Canna indica]|uniref:Type II inositol polyphosphate 5-phosphatase 15-like n=1 Tax=Canna indica TaxID=4628 RepID=A0AAQ3JW09_9LILI|nr:type II inositol polyphosphate 5-phosphatase 15-like [Canna indica]
MEQSLVDDDDDWSFITNSFAAVTAMPPPVSQPPPQGQPIAGHDSPAAALSPDPAAFQRLSFDDPPSTVASAPSRSYSSPHPNLTPPIPPHGFPPSCLSDRVSPSKTPSVLLRSNSLPEFIGMAVRHGIFKPPIRAPVHPGRPPSIELRPHPLRETQVGCFIRTIAGSATQLWAGQENGVRVWNLSDVFEGFGRRDFSSWRPNRGDEESAPFRESSFTSPTICLVVDSDRGFVCSGHKDGQIRIWRLEQPQVRNCPPERRGDLAESLSWQAHQSPILSMAITSHGEVWSGSEGGAITAWSWKIIFKAFSMRNEERNQASALIERYSVDLRSLVTVGGMCPLPTADIKYLLSDNFSSKVWSSSDFSFALWYHFNKFLFSILLKTLSSVLSMVFSSLNPSLICVCRDSRTKELLKVFNIDGQVETRFDICQVQDSYEVGDTKLNLFSTSKKAINFFQRSRHALLEAADAVRKAAAKGGFFDDYRRTEALTMSVNGMIWTGCANGLLIQWDRCGNRLQEVQHHSSSIQCLCTFGTRLWVGYMDGILQVMNSEGNLLGGWNAHSSPIIKIVVVGSFIFTLANLGGIRGWYLTSPGPLDNILQLELTHKKLLYTRLENLKILAGSWNVGQERAYGHSLKSWLSDAAGEVGLVVIGLQEVEMGAGFLAMSAAKETVGLEGSSNGQWWLEAIGKILDEGTLFELIGSRQLAGLLVAVWARKSLKPYIGDVDAAAVPCGLGRAIGNKGAVALRMRIYDRKICFINCHFAAHLEAVNRRNADFDHVFRTMTFSRSSSGLNVAAGGASAVHMQRGTNVNDDRTPELSEADMIVFLGDFNYRLHGITYEEAIYLISQRRFDVLTGKDQLQAEMKAGRVFQGFREGEIKFPPTYKFEKHQTGLSGYDSSEKKRIPAWCDRILYRDSRCDSVTECSLSCPVVSFICMYDSCMDVMGSDHKPIKCIFTVNIAHVDESTRRKEFGEIIFSKEKVRRFIEEFVNVPETTFSSNNIALVGKDTTVLRITNKCRRDIAVFEVSHESQASVKESGQASEFYSTDSFGFPSWLQVIPMTGIIKPGQTVEVSLWYQDVHIVSDMSDRTHKLQQNCLIEDSKDKIAVLKVSITGNYSTESRTYLIHVCHCSSKSNHNGSRGVSSWI